MLVISTGVCLVAEHSGKVYELSHVVLGELDHLSIDAQGHFLKQAPHSSNARPYAGLFTMRYGVLQLTSVVVGEGIPAAAHEDFTAMVPAVGPAFGKIAEISGIDQLAVECVLAEQFVKAVESRMRRFGEDDREAFTTERVGGVVAAKNLAQAEDDSEVAIVFDASMWVGVGVV